MAVASRGSAARFSAAGSRALWRQFVLGSLAAGLLMVGFPAGAHAACANVDVKVNSGADAATVDGARRAVSCLVNQERVRYGLPALTVDTRLQAAAQQHTDDMLARNFFNHTNPDGKGPAERVSAQGYQWGSVAENIAAGQNSPRDVVDSWMRSTGHCQNILSPENSQIGVGLQPLPPAKNNGLGAEWTQVFARPIDEEAQSTDNGPQNSCPLTLGPDQDGPGDDGTGPAGALGPNKAVKVAVRRFGHVRVVARAFGRSVLVGGVVSRERAGRRLSVTVTRYGHLTRRLVITGASGDFTVNLRIPTRHVHDRGSRRIVVGVRVLSRARIKPSLQGGKGRVG